MSEPKASQSAAALPDVRQPDPNMQLRKKKGMSETKTVKGHVRDMTSGGIMNHILMFAVPMVIANIFQQLYGLVDTMVAGQNLGDTAIAAIGATTALYGFILNFAIGINAGCSIIVTQYFGAHDVKTLRESIKGTLILNTLTTLILTVLALVFMKPLLNFMNVPESIYNDAYLYITVICAGMFATVAYNMGAGILRAFGNSRAPLIFVIIGSVLHIVLDYVFIAWMKTGVVGASVATIISNGVAAALSFIFIFKNYKEYLPTKEEKKVPHLLMADLARVGVAMGLTFSVIDLGDVIYGSANNSLGDLYITAYSSARRILNVFMVPLNTPAAAGSTFVGQNWGAGKYDRIRSAIRKVLLLEVVVGLVLFAIGFVFAEPMVRIVSSSEDPAVISNAVRVLHWFFPMFAPLGLLFAFRTAMQGMGHTTPAVIAGGIEMAVKVLSALFVVERIGFFATCITEPTTWVINAIWLACADLYLRKRIYPDLPGSIGQ